MGTTTDTILDIMWVFTNPSSFYLSSKRDLAGFSLDHKQPHLVVLKMNVWKNDFYYFYQKNLSGYYSRA